MRAIEAGQAGGRTVTVGTPLHEVARLMAEDGRRAVVVTDGDGAPAGIVSERDLVVRGLAWNLSSDTPVEAVMTPDVLVTDASALARSVYRLLRTHGVRQVPLVENGRVVGIISREDLVDEADSEVLADLRRCPACGREWLRPVSTLNATNFLCLLCRSCWQLQGGKFARVEPRSCSGCPEHNFCRFPLIDYGVDTSRLPTPRRTN